MYSNWYDAVNTNVTREGQRADIREAQWVDIKSRLNGKHLLQNASVEAGAASISIRCEGTRAMLYGRAESATPEIWWTDSADFADDVVRAHAEIYRERGDVGAIVYGGGAYGNVLVDFGGVIPVLFDEQARHIGAMQTPARAVPDVLRSLSGAGNAVLFNGVPMCIGMTPQRLMLNAELFEKCAEAFVLATAAGARVTLLPWLVRRIAGGRLRKDQRRARECFAAGVFPPESRGY